MRSAPEPTLNGPADWRELTPAQAIAWQRTQAARVQARDRMGALHRVAGVDVGFEDAGRTVRAAVAVLAYPGLTPLTAALVRRACTFPYVPGLLSLRELPAILDALTTLEAPPDLILCDGHGYAHPRRFGLACHLGVTVGVATIGVGKTRLTGMHDAPAAARGARAPLVGDGEIIGSVLRTRTGIAPVYVSVGHHISLETAVRLVLDCTPRYRLPEPIRAAHRLASGPARGPRMRALR